MYAFCSQWLDWSPNLKPLMSFAHKVSSSVKPLLKSVSKLTMARFWKSIQGGKQTKNLWSQSVFLSISLVLSLNLFLQCTKADKIIFSVDNKLLLFFFFSPKYVRRHILGLWEDTGAIAVAVEVGQLFEAWSPVAEIVIVLIWVCT